MPDSGETPPINPPQGPPNRSEDEASSSWQPESPDMWAEEDEDRPAWQPDDVRVWEQAAAVTQDVRREVRERARVARQSRSRSGGGSRSRERKRSDHPRTRERSPEGPRPGGDGWPPDSPAGRGSDRRRKRRKGRRGWSKRRLVLVGAGLIVLAAGAIVADGYYQTYQVYQELRTLQPEITAAKASLSRGLVPSGDPFARISEVASKAQDEMQHARFTMSITGAIPFLNRPVRAARFAADAANEEAQAAVIVRDIVIDLLGQAALTGQANQGGNGSSGTSAKHGARVFHHGVVDVQVLSGLVPRLRQVIAHVEAADRDLRSIPTIPAIKSVTVLKDRAIADSARVKALTERGLSVLRLIPSFFGAGGERTYYLAMQQNAALRGTGGSVLAYGILTVTNGALKLERFGSIYDLDIPRGGIPVGASRDLTWYVQHAAVNPRLANGMNYSPDFPLVAGAWKAQVEKVTGQHIDGVIALDPFAVAALLQGIQPIKVEAYPDHITAKNVVRVVEHDQFELPRAQQNALPGEVIHRAFTLLLQSKDVVGMVHHLGAALADKRVQMWSSDPGQQAFLQQLGWDGGLRENPGDFLALAQENRLGNKLDYWGKDAIEYTATIGANGSVKSNYRVTLTNGVPVPVKGSPGAVGPPRTRGLTREMMNLYVPKDARFGSVDPTEVTGPGADKVRPPGFVEHVEGGYRVFTQTISAEPQQSASLTFAYSTPGVILDTSEGRLYQLTIQHQPLVNPANLTVKVVLPAGAKPVPAPGWTVNGNVATYHGALTRDLVLRLAF